jgi:hypothetical protein
VAEPYSALYLAVEMLWRPLCHNQQHYEELRIPLKHTMTHEGRGTFLIQSGHHTSCKCAVRASKVPVPHQDTGGIVG